MSKNKEPDEIPAPPVVGRKRTCAWCGQCTIKMIQNGHHQLIYRCASCQQESVWVKESCTMVRIP